MLIAAVGHINGNLPALEAVLAAIDDMGIQTILNVGDVAVGQPWVNEVIDRLRERVIVSVQGETDRRLAQFTRKRTTLVRKLDSEAYERLQRAHETLRCDNLEYLRNLPRRRDFMLEGVAISLFHGSPTSQMEHLEAEDRDDRFRRIREVTNAELLVFGGEPGGFAKTIDMALFVSPGTIDSETASARYVIIDTESSPWRADIQTVSF